MSSWLVPLRQYQTVQICVTCATGQPFLFQFERGSIRLADLTIEADGRHIATQMVQHADPLYTRLVPANRGHLHHITGAVVSTNITTLLQIKTLTWIPCCHSQIRQGIDNFQNRFPYFWCPVAALCYRIFNTKAICVVDPDSLDVLYEGLGIKQIFYNFCSSKNWIRIHLKCWIRILIQINWNWNSSSSLACFLSSY